MTQRIQIRDGKVSDLPHVFELIKELAEFTGYLDQVSNSVTQMEIDGFGKNPIYGFLVAEQENHLIGTSIYYYRYSTWKGKRLYLEDLVVKEAWRGKGVGNKLFDATMKKALDEKCSGMMWQVLAWNEKAMDFYKKHNAKFDNEFVNCSLEQDQMKLLLN